MILDLFIITTIICFIVDISGIIESIEWWLSKWLKVPCKIPKPFNCSLCMTFWIGLIWITIHGFTLFNLLFVTVFAALAEDITGFIKIIKYLLNKVRDAIVLRLNN
jgi:hypothetical protein